tara:strand:+ start:56573 stop:56941 length:369 start_codon:yes stop_codon:yes gene_type:complete
MKTVSSFWTLLSSLIISIGAGHGVAPIVLIQFSMIFKFSDTDQIWLLPVLIFFVGQISLIVSLFTERKKRYYYFGGSLIVFIGIIILVFIGRQDYSSEIPTLITMIPFTILVVKSLKTKAIK